MKLKLLALAAMCTCAFAQLGVFPPNGGTGGTGVANIHADIAGPSVTTSGVIDITAMALTTAALQNTLQATCWTGVGFSGGLVTGNLTPLSCSITNRSATAVTVTFASSSNILVVLNSNGGAGPVGPVGPAGATGPAGSGNMLITSGATDPSGACTAGIAQYLQTTTLDEWFCAVSGTWKKKLSTLGPFTTQTATINVFDPVIGDSGRVIWEQGRAITITRVACNVTGGTNAVINLYKQTEAAPEGGAGGVKVITADLTCTAGALVTTSTFAAASVATRIPVALTLTSLSGTNTNLRVFIEYTID